MSFAACALFAEKAALELEIDLLFSYVCSSAFLRSVPATIHIASAAKQRGVGKIPQQESPDAGLP